MEVHSIRIPTGTWRRIVQAADRDGVAAAEWLRRQAELGLERTEGRHQAEDLARETARLAERVARLERALARRGL